VFIVNQGPFAVTLLSITDFSARRSLLRRSRDAFIEQPRSLDRLIRSAYNYPPSMPSPWRCPACATPIPLSASETRPRRSAVYRCPVCRLELTYDETRGILDVPPIDGETMAYTRAAKPK
jgi:hypothetical protein